MILLTILRKSSHVACQLIYVALSTDRQVLDPRSQCGNAPRTGAGTTQAEQDGSTGVLTWFQRLVMGKGLEGQHPAPL